MRIRGSGFGRSALAVLGVVAVVAAGCSGGDSSEGGGEDDAAAEQTAEEDAAAGEDAESDDAGGSEDDAEATQAADGEPFRVGVLQPLSGNVAFLGTAQLDVFNAYFDRLNAEGGIDGHPIEIVAEDNQAAVDRTLSGFRSLTEQDVSVILGPSISSNVEAVAPLAEEQGVSLVTVGAFLDIIETAPNTVFQVGSTSASDAQAHAKFARDLFPDLEEIKAALIPIDTPSSFAWRDDLQERWGPELGITFTSSTTIPLTAQDLTAEAQAALEGDPDVIMTEALDASLPLLVDQFRQLGFEGPVIGWHAGNANATVERIADPDVFVFKEMRGMTDDTEGRPGLAWMQETIEQAGLTEAMNTISQSALGWMGAEIVVGVLEQCGFPCDAAAFTDTIDDIVIDTEGVTFEPIVITPDEHQGVNDVVMYHWDGTQVAPYSDTTYSTSLFE